MCALVTQGRGLSLINGIEPDLSTLTVLRLRDRCWGLCYFWYTFRLWVISSANTASPSIYMLTMHKFIPHSPMLTPKNLLRPIQEWIKNCILVAFRDLDGSQQTEAQQRKTKLLLLHLIFRRCLTLDSLWEMTPYIRPIMRATLGWCLTLYIDVRKACLNAFSISEILLKLGSICHMKHPELWFTLLFA